MPAPNNSTVEQKAPVVVVVGANGDLGGRIVGALRARGADVRAVVRPGRASAVGGTVREVDVADAAAVAAVVAGADCVVSALQGLRDVIVDVQTAWLGAALAAGVERFIPSDFSTDFTDLPVGSNRNFDLRREFSTIIDRAQIRTTSIFNGAFAEVLNYNIPLLDFQKKTIGYWQDPDWKIDFTTIDDTAAYTAAVALDAAAPRALRIASVQLSANDLVRFTTDVLKTPFTPVKLGSRAELAAHNERARAAHPEGEREVFPAWQRSQYMHSMFTAHHAALDNDRYSGLRWTPLSAIVQLRH